MKNENPSCISHHLCWAKKVCDGVTYSISTYQEILGEMGTPCTDCPAVEVTKGGKKVILYIPDKVKFH